MLAAKLKARRLKMFYNFYFLQSGMVLELKNPLSEYLMPISVRKVARFHYFSC